MHILLIEINNNFFNKKYNNNIINGCARLIMPSHYITNTLMEDMTKSRDNVSFINDKNNKGRRPFLADLYLSVCTCIYIVCVYILYHIAFLNRLSGKRETIYYYITPKYHVV